MSRAAGLATPPDPPRDRGGRPVPEHIAAMLSLVAVLADYGRHLAATIEHRALWRGFATIAQFFGTAHLPVIVAHIQRGIMRTAALQRMLLERARRGRDLVVLAPRRRVRRAAQPAAPLPDPAAPPAAGPQPAAPPPNPTPRPARGTLPPPPLTLDTLPSMADIEAEVRRRPVGQTIVDICRDLGIAPTLCDGRFWNRAFMAIRCYRGSFNNIMLEMRRREKRFDREQWRYPNLALPEQTAEGVRRVLGFLIGETPVDPHRPAPAPAVPAGGPLGEPLVGPPGAPLGAPVAAATPAAAAPSAPPVAAAATGPP